LRQKLPEINEQTNKQLNTFKKGDTFYWFWCDVLKDEHFITWGWFVRFVSETWLDLANFNRCCQLWPFTGHIKTAKQRSSIQWLVHWPLVAGMLHLVQRGRAWAGCGPGQSHPRCKNVRASVPTSYYSMWHYNNLCNRKGLTIMG